MEIQYRSHIKDRNGVTFIAIINPVPNIQTRDMNFLQKQVIFNVII